MSIARRTLPHLIAAAVVLPALCLLFLTQGCSRETNQWRAIEDCGKPLLGHMNSHATAAAWMVRHYGWGEEDWTDKRLVAAMNVYSVVDCGDCPVPSIWHLDDGLRKYLQANGIGGFEITEWVVNTNDRREAVDFADYAGEIDAGRPVLVTLCYDPQTADKPSYARQRALHATSMVGIGYAELEGRRYMICHDGFEEPPTRRKVIGDWEAGQAAAPDTPGPWRQTGTSLYPWDGEHVNVLMVFVRPSAN